MTHRSPHLRAAVTALCGALLNSSLCADWFQYRGPQVDGISHERIQCAFPAGAPRCLWRVPTPAGLSSFAVEGGKAFTLVTRELDGAKSEVCVALDANSGKELWAARVGSANYPGGGESGTPDNRGGDGPRSTPAAGPNRVYVYSSEMVLQCLYASSGKPIWAKDIIKEFGGENLKWKSAMSPVLDGGLVSSRAEARASQ